MKPLIAARYDERMLRAWAANVNVADLEHRGWLARRGIFPVRGSGEVVLRKWQAALESTRGTNLAATRKVYGIGHMTKDVPAIFPTAHEERGTFIANYRSQQGLVRAASAIDGPLTYEDAGWWFELALKGSVNGVLENTTAYRYTFVPTAATDDLASATVEWGDDTQAFKGNYGMVEQFEITGAIAEQLKFKATLFQDDMATATFTGALTDRTTEDVLMRTCKFAIGALGAVPSGYLTGRFIAFKLTIKNNLFRKYFADGTGQKYTGMGRKKRQYTLEITYEGNAATITERGVWEAGTQRVGRVTGTGTVISGGAGFRTLDVVMPGVWTAFPAGERDSNTVFAAVMESQYDATLAYDLSVAVVNALTGPYT